MWINLSEIEMKMISARIFALTSPEGEKLKQKIDAALNQPEDERVEAELYREVAVDKFEDEGELEFDDVPAISFGDDKGAYVMCWCWVSEDNLDQWVKKKS